MIEFYFFAVHNEELVCRLFWMYMRNFIQICLYTRAQKQSQTKAKTVPQHKMFKADLLATTYNFSFIRAFVFFIS